MLFRESETIELKEIVVDEIKKEIIAFANCDGGKLYIGVQDNGTVVGVNNPDGVSLQISNMVRDAIKPDVTMFLHYETREEEGKKSLLWIFSEEQTALTILQRKGCGRRVYMSGRVVLRFLLPTRQFAV